MFDERMVKEYREVLSRFFTEDIVIDVLKYLNRFVLRDKEKYLTDIRDTISLLDSQRHIKGCDSDVLATVFDGNAEIERKANKTHGR